MLYTDVRSGVHADLASLVKFRPTKQMLQMLVCNFNHDRYYNADMGWGKFQMDAVEHAGGRVAQIRLSVPAGRIAPAALLSCAQSI